MPAWGELILDLILCSLYIYLLIRLATSQDHYFKTPFYIFFIATGIYSVISLVCYRIFTHFTFTERLWTICIYKSAYAFNAFGAEGATLGKATIAIHRYFVLRSSDLTEKKWSSSTVRRVLLAQCALSLLATTAIWPAHYVYKQQDTMDEVIGLDRRTTLIQKAIAISSYVLYVICNGIFTLLTTKELLRFRRIMKTAFSGSSSLMVQQRNMFIIVTVCSLSHLVKALQQFSVAVATYLEIWDLFHSLVPWYPLVNGLATYSAPFCLIILSHKVKARFFSWP